MALRPELAPTGGFGPGFGPAVPVTPTKKRANAGEFDLWFLEFSNSYNLNLRRPDPKLTRQQRKALPYYSELQYYDRLSYQYHKGNPAHIRDRFDQGAREIHTRWVPKPRGDTDVTPPITHLPRATSEPERCQLLELLSAILEDLSPRKPSRTLAEAPGIFSPRTPRSSADSPSPSVSRQSKRPSEESPPGTPSKRSRSSSSDDTRLPGGLSDVGDVYPTAAQLAKPIPSFPPRLLARPGESSRTSQSKQSFYGVPQSVNTSKSTLLSNLSNIFSERDENEMPASQETQVTVEASAHEKMRQLAHASDSDSLAPSSTENALNISFNSHHALQQNVQDLLMRSSPSNPYSDLSLLTVHEVTRLDPPNMMQSSSSPPREADHLVMDSPGVDPRLEGVWPLLPSHLDLAPFAVRWEILRVALHCGVQVQDLRLEYDPSLNDQSRLWSRLHGLPVFQDKSFPEKSRSEAWNACLNGNFRTTDQVVLLSASLTMNTSKTGPQFHLQLQPLKLDLPHRLDRRFGSDRFLEVVMPSMSSYDIAKALDETALESLHRWLVNHPHTLLGRTWMSYFVKPSLPKKVSKGDTLRPETKTVPQERIYLFAEDGDEFHLPTDGDRWPTKGQASNSHTRMTRYDLLDWLLQMPKNQKQPVLKLFSRISLGLSRTHPTVVVQQEQIRHRSQDILSPTDEVMNDGIARMSFGLARKIRDLMGLADIPSGFQGRFGSAKGFWIRDTTDTSDEIWIETFPSQRKWDCDYLDDDHRTFEVRSEARELKSANLNLQLLPILEDRAFDKSSMKAQVGSFMKDSLLQELGSQKDAMQDPLQFSLWVHNNSSSSRRQDRVKYGEVRCTAALPSSREDQMTFLLDHGFEPTKLEFLRKIAWNLRKEKCEEIQKRLNVKVGRSTYAYMVVDFLGVLEEDEVHLGFSSKFTDEQSDFSETFLHGMDILVARTPAHYPSDIQRVKAVFKPELGSLKDVIVFSTKGNTPLADKLSGGDYDGDIAWICWEPEIVGNFENADMPVVPDLFEQGILAKQAQTYGDLLLRDDIQDVTSEFLDQAFRFNMEQSLLGVCTNYKDRLCYSRGSVRDEPAIFLSTLISHLVDRTKQGIIFTDKDWSRLRKSLNGKQADPQKSKQRMDPPLPQYKNNDWAGQGKPTHIIDYVKFHVGKPTVERELRALDEFLSQAEHFDKDLVRFYQYYEKLQRPPDERKKAQLEGMFKRTTWETILEELRKDIDEVATEWVKSSGDWDAKVTNLYDMWQNISITRKVKSDKVRNILQEGDLARAGLSGWDLLKASCCFKLYYKRQPGFPWYMAGWQLAALKAIYVSQGVNARPVVMLPIMYASKRPDGGFIRGWTARNEGRRLELADEEEEDEEMRGDDA